MILRESQFAVLSRRKEKVFEDRLVDHVQRFFPEQAEALKRDALLSLLEVGLAKARSYGLRSERDLCKFMNLIFTFGLNFDVDERLPWARRNLEATGIGPTLRINRLYLDALEHEDEGRGWVEVEEGGASS